MRWLRHRPGRPLRLLLLLICLQSLPTVIRGQLPLPATTLPATTLSAPPVITLVPGATTVPGAAVPAPGAAAVTNPAATAALQTCRVSMAVSDVNRDNLLSQTEYVAFVNRLTGNRLGAAAFAALPASLQTAYITLAAGSPQLPIVGASPATYGTATAEQKALLDKICNTVQTAIGAAATAIPAASAIPQPATQVPGALATSTGLPAASAIPQPATPVPGPASASATALALPQCRVSMAIADINRDSQLDANEYVSFINRLTRNAYLNVPFTGLPPGLQTNFNTLAALTPPPNTIDITGAQPQQFATATASQQASLEKVCVDTQALTGQGAATTPITSPPITAIPAATATPGITLVPFVQCRARMHVADTNGDKLLSSEEYATFVNRLVPASSYPTFASLPARVQSTFAALATTGGQINIFGSIPSQAADTVQLAFLEKVCTNTQVALAGGTPPPGVTVTPATVPPLTGGGTVTPATVPPLTGGSTALPATVPPLTGGITILPATVPPLTGGSTALPATVPPLPGGITVTPGTVPPPPGGSTTLPGTVPPLLGGSTATPGTASPLPGGSTALPATVPPLPGGSTATPGTVTPLPGGSTALPAIVTPLPGGNTATTGTVTPLAGAPLSLMPATLTPGTAPPAAVVNVPTFAPIGAIPCGQAMRQADVNVDNLLDPSEYTAFVILLIQSFHFAGATYNDLPQNLKVVFAQYSEGGTGKYWNIAPANPSLPQDPAGITSLQAACTATVTAINAYIIARSSPPPTIPPLVLTPPATCKARANQADVDQNAQLNQAEYTTFVTSMATPSALLGPDGAPATVFMSLPAGLQTAYNTLAARTPTTAEIGIAGANPAVPATPVQDAELSQICQGTDDAIYKALYGNIVTIPPNQMPTAFPTPRPTVDPQKCNLDMATADLNKDAYLEPSEYVAFLNLISNNQFVGVNYAALHPLLVSNFNSLAAVNNTVPNRIHRPDAIDILGANLLQHTVANEQQLQFLRVVCTNTTFAFQDALRPPSMPPTGRPTISPAPSIAPPPSVAPTVFDGILEIHSSFIIFNRVGILVRT
jgi:hypothetical protein